MIVVLIEFVAALVTGAVAILKARTATRIEIAASTGLAALLVSETIRLVQNDTSAEQLLADLPLQLRSVRHVRVSVLNEAGVPVKSFAPANGPGTTQRDAPARAPAWFASLIAPPADIRSVPVIVNGQSVGSVVVAAEPADEIAEVWENIVALTAAGAVVNLAAFGILYVLFGRALDPLTHLSHGLLDLERQNYEVRQPSTVVREFAGLTSRFNALAETLDAARSENARLNHRLITTQDDERRRTALELHDEVGPSLFGLKALAHSVTRTMAGRTDAPAREVIEQTSNMLAIIEHLQAINRSLLKRLRPMALGHVPLRDLISETVRERARRHPDIAVSFSAEGLSGSYGDSIDLTIYRCAQESLTNALRHAQAKHIALHIRESHAPATGVDAGPWLELAVDDDGRGIDPNARAGFGLQGMQERVLALGGKFSIESTDPRGTRVRIIIPVGAPRE